VKEKIQQFFIGRNGFDDLSRATSWLACGIVLVSWLFSKVLGGVVSSVLWFLGLALIIYAYYRAFSKNVYKRTEENNKYLNARYAQKSKVAGSKERFAQRKEYKFFTCPSCHTMLRVPRGKGKIVLTCKKCGNRFEGRT
jgi:ribosomal protein L37AE/L43A